MAKKYDLDGLTAALKAIPKQIRDDIDPALEKGADEMVARMRFLVPDDPKTSGNDLKSKIRKSRGDVPLAVRISAIDENADGEDNALFQEYGTADMSANPFFWPSVNTTKTRIRRRIDRAISKAIDKAWGKK